MHVRPTWAALSYLQDAMCGLLGSIRRDFRRHLYNVAQINPCGGWGSQETSDSHHPHGPAGVTPHVPSAGTTLLWRPSGICPAPHPTPSLPGQGPAATPTRGCGVWGSLYLGPSQWEQRSTEATHQHHSEGHTLSGGLRREGNPWPPPLGLPLFFTLAASPASFAPPKEAPTVQNLSRCPTSPCPVSIHYSLPGTPASDLKRWIPSLPCPLASDWVWPTGSRTQDQGQEEWEGRVFIPGFLPLPLSDDPHPLPWPVMGRGRSLLWLAGSNPAHIIAKSSLLTTFFHGLAGACHLFPEAGDQHPFCLHELKLGCRSGRETGGPVSREVVKKSLFKEATVKMRPTLKDPALQMSG